MALKQRTFRFCCEPDSHVVERSAVLEHFTWFRPIGPKHFNIVIPHERLANMVLKQSYRSKYHLFTVVNILIAHLVFLFKISLLFVVNKYQASDDLA